MCRSSQIYRYDVDASDFIVWVDNLWLAFAKENGAPQLNVDSVLGHSLWDFVSGDVTRRLYSEIHTRVRSTGNSVVLPFRCDSPSLKRHMQLTITQREGLLRYESILLRAEPHGHFAALESERPRSECVLTMCSCCKRALLESLGWLDVEDFSARLRLFDSVEVPQLRYNVCPQCAQLMKTAGDNGNAA